MSARDKERRRSKRRRRRLPVKFWRGDVEGTGFTTDISNTGLMVETTASADIGSRFHIELQLPEGTPYFAEGVVARKKVYPRHAASMFKSGLGFRFVALGEAIRAVLEEKPEDDSPRTCETPRTDCGFLVDLRDPGELKARLRTRHQARRGSDPGVGASSHRRGSPRDVPAAGPKREHRLSGRRSNARPGAAGRGPAAPGGRCRTHASPRGHPHHLSSRRGRLGPHFGWPPCTSEL